MRAETVLVKAMNDLIATTSAMQALTKDGVLDALTARIVSRRSVSMGRYSAYRRLAERILSGADRDLARLADRPRVAKAA